MSRDSVEIMKFSVILMLSFSGLISIFLPDTIRVILLIDGSQVFDISPILYIIFITLNICQAILLLIYFIRIHRNAPPSIQKYSRLSLTGVIIMAFGPITILAGLTTTIPSFHTLSLGIGIFLISISLYHEPRQAYVLPFQVLRLSVFNLESGLPLFSHTWEAGIRLSDENLFSAMLQGIMKIMKESINQGELRTIELERAVLLLQRKSSKGFACVLISTKKSRSRMMR